MLSIVPIQAIPNYKFTSKIPVDGQNLILQFELQYNELQGYWLVNISNYNGKSLISCLPLLPAENILEQHRYLNIGSAYIVPVQTTNEQWPTRYTLGTEWHLIWDDTDRGLL